MWNKGLSGRLLYPLYPNEKAGHNRDMATKYYVVRSDHPDTLDDLVNERLAQGWQLQGGISVCVIPVPEAGHINSDVGDAHWYTYVQAVVREE
jgi:hypothetical protein